MTNRNLLFLGSAAMAAGFATALRRSRRRMDLAGKVVLITGGSRGLGLAMARQFASEGANLILCARDSEELCRAKRDLCPLGRQILTVSCDVTDRHAVDRLIQAGLRVFGRIDVLVNNAGIIQVGPIDTMTIEDFETTMDVMFWGTVYTTMAVLPHMREQGQGRIVNITSVGAKVPVPHLLPYCCAKFAAGAFSEGMRSELSGTGIKVVTIAPGLMRTGSYLNAIFKGAEEGEAAWFSLGSSLPGISMGADRAASQIVAAARTGRAEQILTTQANLLTGFHGLFPGITSELMGLVNRALPNGSQRTERGSDSAILEKPWLRALTLLGRQAAERFLQPEAPRPLHRSAG